MLEHDREQVGTGRQTGSAVSANLRRVFRRVVPSAHQLQSFALECEPWLWMGMAVRSTYADSQGAAAGNRAAARSSEGRSAARR